MIRIIKIPTVEVFAVGILFAVCRSGYYSLAAC